MSQEWLSRLGPGSYREIGDFIRTKTPCGFYVLLSRVVTMARRAGLDSLSSTTTTTPPPPSSLCMRDNDPLERMGTRGTYLSTGKLLTNENWIRYEGEFLSRHGKKKRVAKNTYTSVKSSGGGGRGSKNASVFYTRDRTKYFWLIYNSTVRGSCTVLGEAVTQGHLHTHTRLPHTPLLFIFSVRYYMPAVEARSVPPSQRWYKILLTQDMVFEELPLLIKNIKKVKKGETSSREKAIK